MEQTPPTLENKTAALDTLLMLLRAITSAVETVHGGPADPAPLEPVYCAVHANTLRLLVGSSPLVHPRKSGTKLF